MDRTMSDTAAASLSARPGGKLAKPTGCAMMASHLVILNMDLIKMTQL